jgi:hypothetical protein
MAWYCAYLPDFNIKMFNWTVVVLWSFEIIYIAAQAAKGQLSHYNHSTPLYSALYAMMALAATIVTVYTAYIGYLFFRNEFTGLPDCIRLISGGRPDRAGHADTRAPK